MDVIVEREGCDDALVVVDDGGACTVEGLLRLAKAQLSLGSVKAWEVIIDGEAVEDGPPRAVALEDFGYDGATAPLRVTLRQRPWHAARAKLKGLGVKGGKGAFRRAVFGERWDVVRLLIEAAPGPGEVWDMRVALAEQLVVCVLQLPPRRAASLDDEDGAPVSDAAAPAAPPPPAKFRKARMEGTLEARCMALIRAGAAMRDEPPCKVPERAGRFSQTGALTNLTKAGDGALHVAARLGALPVVAELVEYGADPLAVNRLGESAMHLAARAGHPDVVEALLHAGGVASLDGRGNTPVHHAVKHLPRAAVAGMLDAAGDGIINAPNDAGDTPLHRAARSGRAEVVYELLVRHGDAACINQDGDTALHAAVAGPGRADARASLAEALLRRCAGAVGVPNAAGRTPLHHAAAAGRLEVCEVLCAEPAGAQAVHCPDAEGATPLLLAAQGGVGWSACVDTGHIVLEQPPAAQSAAYDAICVALLSRGADPDAVDSRGDTTLHHAARAGLPQAVTQLLSGGHAASPGGAGFTPLHWAAVAACVAEQGYGRRGPGGKDDRNEEWVRAREKEALSVALAHAAADVDKTSDTGHTALHLAAASLQARACDVLLARGACAERADPRGNTPLHVAAVRKYAFGARGVAAYEAIREALLVHGAPPEAMNDQGNTARELEAWAEAVWRGQPV